MTNHEEQQHTWRPKSLAEAWAEFAIDVGEVDPQKLNDMRACFYGGACALLAVLWEARESAPDGEKSQAVAAALNAAERDTKAFFDGDEAPCDMVTLKVLEVQAETADELVAKVRELVPLAPEQEADIRKMHAERVTRNAKKH